MRPRDLDDGLRDAGTAARGLLVLGVLALVAALVRGPGPVPADQVGEVVPLVLEDLRGEAFRLLPGVGPVLAARLEDARVAAGGRLDPGDARRVHGVGEVLSARWQALRPR